MKIIIETIPHKKQRYETCGDWYYKDGTLNIMVSEEVGSWQEQVLIAIHELIECQLCAHAGVTQESVDHFDAEFEKHRHPDNYDEPGDDSSAPYYKQHQIATGVERILAAELAVDWNSYADRIESL